MEKYNLDEQSDVPQHFHSLDVLEAVIADCILSANYYRSVLRVVKGGQMLSDDPLNYVYFDHRRCDEPGLFLY